MRSAVGILLLGVLAVAAATAIGGASAVLDAIAAPPTLIRAALVGASAVAAVALLAGSVAALGSGAAPDHSMGTLIRGVRLAFLAVAALAAGAGWLVGQPVLLVIALVIAGVDIVETTFLLLVARTHRSGD
jgi:hypothetical protein